MARSTDTPSSESRTALPLELEEELFDICLGDDEGAEPVQRLEELCARHPEHARELRRVAARLIHTAGQVPDLAVLESVEEDVPSLSIPPYRIVREIGRGGFGVVWLAEQSEPLQRVVALKVLLPSAMTSSMLERFEIERRTLAQMQHPGIANILDAGTGPAGEPYFAMEYVDGVPVTRYCDENRLAVDQRLNLFLDVCRAVQHAHQNGVIHRDLKPSNILVTDHDGPHPKIIDFGLAKVLESSAPGATPLTEQGRLLGTLEYMSPEQAAGEHVDTRTDIYALGVLLYELLTGTLPFDSRELREGGWSSALRIIREHDPRPPSEVVARSREDHAAQLRRSTNAELARRLRGDLSWIVMTALEKDVDRRYATVADLAEDVRRHLADQPISVGAPSLGYVVRKFARRHRTGVAAAGAILAVVLVGITLSIWGVVQIYAAWDEAVYQQYCAHISAAKAEMDANQAGRMRETLAAAPEGLRHWEWRYLAAQADQSVKVLRSDRGQLRSVGLLDGGAAVVAVTYLEPIEQAYVWDLASGEQRYVLPLGDEVHLLAARPGGDAFALAFSSGEVRLHDAATGKLLRRVWVGREHASAAFSHDGKTLAMASKGTIMFLDVASRDRVGPTLHLAEHAIQDLCFAPGGQRVISCGNEGTIVVWDLASGEPVRTWQSGRELRSIDVDRTGRYVACACRTEGTVPVFDLTAGTLHQVLYVGRKPTRVAFHPTEATLAVGAFDGTVMLWDVVSGAPTGTFRGHAASVDGLQFSPDGATLVSASWDGTVREWRVDDSVRLDRFAGVPRDARRLAVDPARTLVVAGYADGRFEARDLETGERDWAIQEDAAAPRWLELIDHGRRVVTCDQERALRVLDAGSGARIAAATADGTFLEFYDASDDGRRIVLKTSATGVTVYDAETLQVVRSFDLPDAVVSGRFVDAHGSRLVVSAGPVQAWDVDSGQRLWEVELATAANALAVAPGGRTFCVSDLRGGFSLRDTATGAAIRALRETIGRNASAVYKAEFSPDGARIATLSRDEVVRIWDAERGTVLLALPDQSWCEPRFSSDGATLFAVVGEGERQDVLVWRAPFGSGPVHARR